MQVPLLGAYFCVSGDPKYPLMEEEREEGDTKVEKFLLSACLHMVSHGCGVFRNNTRMQTFMGSVYTGEDGCFKPTIITVRNQLI